MFSVLAVYGFPSLVKDKKRAITTKKSDHLEPTGYMEIVMLALLSDHHFDDVYISAGG